MNRSSHIVTCSAEAWIPPASSIQEIHYPLRHWEFSCSNMHAGSVHQVCMLPWQVLQGDEERVAAWRQLDRQYQDMWLKWEAHEGEVRQETQDQANEEERQAFINSLISQVGTFLAHRHLSVEVSLGWDASTPDFVIAWRWQYD